MKLPYEFYHQNCLKVAKELLGKTLIFNDFQGIITENVRPLCLGRLGTFMFI